VLHARGRFAVVFLGFGFLFISDKLRILKNDPIPSPPQGPDTGDSETVRVSSAASRFPARERFCARGRTMRTNSAPSRHSIATQPPHGGVRTTAKRKMEILFWMNSRKWAKRGW